MAYAYMANNPPDIQAWASLSIQNALGTNTPITYERIKVPVLDLFGANDLPSVLSGVTARETSLKVKVRSKQVKVASTAHFFADQEEVMINTIQAFLDDVLRTPRVAISAMCTTAMLPHRAGPSRMTRR